MKRLTPMTAIREYCKQCTCNQLKQISQCQKKSCALWPFRMRGRPKPGTEEFTLLARKGVK